ncbi:S-layer homology domain-containing protein [Paenibacillus sp. JX-17]|uniref:S-layer homology domain-containing protein n=1 Tax=Paenibacillus lacisoli TaxID=3064525 RepID=A0ABT9CBB1_9BACL|nr:S-layer homology domain-containing protein [Paenibacillus sp. JX-17]MDO7906543.1 S-layer homology domain-containing protein [Paenibacillus sp. JX-17]
MNKKFRLQSIVSFMLILTLIASILPAGAVHAADTDTGASYFHLDNLSTDQASPTVVTSDTIKKIDGTYNGVVASSIRYKSALMASSGKIEDDKYTDGNDIKPNYDETNFHFTNVKVQPGLNRITISGTTTSSNQVERYAYVKYQAVPASYDIKVADGRALIKDTPLIVKNKTISVTLQATSATESVTVNNNLMFNGGSNMFYSSGIELTPGSNELVFVISSGTSKIVETREVVYYPSVGTAYDVKLGTYSLEGSSVVVSPASGDASGKFTGHLVFSPTNADGTAVDSTELPVLNLTVVDSAGTTVFTDAAVVSNKVLGDGTATFDFTSANAYTLSTNGQYTLRLQATYGLQSMGPDTNTYTFRYRNAASPTITGVYQIYNYTGTGSTYTTSSFPTGDGTLFELPLWLKVVTNNPGNVTVKSSATNASVVAQTVTESDTSKLIKITSLPTGAQNLIIDVSNGSDQRVIPITFLSAPFIEVQNVSNNQVFNAANGLTEIKGKVYNFDVDTPSLDITFNGAKKTVTAAADGTFSSAITELLPGPNTITVAGISGGRTVSTTLTVMYFSSNTASISSIVPYPTSTYPNLVDPDKVFKQTADTAYSTNEKTMAIQFGVTNPNSVQVKLSNGDLFASFNFANDTFNLEGGKLKENLALSDYAITRNGTEWIFKFSKIALPQTGDQTVIVQATQGTTVVSKTVTVTREIPPYIILSPKLPNESVIKQNFVNVSIQAEGADSVIIGKTPAVKADPDSDIFRLEVGGLKAGNNTIKFTVTQGTMKTQGQFVVNYSAEASEGAQYKTLLTSSGKANVFGGKVSLTLPKNTLLRPAKKNPTDVPQTVNIFDSQNVLFGIANKLDGRTIKAYNRIGYKEDSEYQDGNLLPLATDTDAALRLNPQSHYGFASELYWIDAGYFKSSSNIEDYNLIPADNPYGTTGNYNKLPNQAGYKFYNRLGTEWLEPTQNGTIAVQYDSNIVNASSSNLGVWWYNPMNNGWVNLGGVINTGKKTVTAPFKGFGYYTVMSLRYSYDDVVAHPTARNDIELMMAKGIMGSKNANEFGVYDSVSRGEFATMLVKMLDIPLDYDTDSNKLLFDDVGTTITTTWDYRYIETAARKGIIRGVGPKLFRPTLSLTREEAASMIARAMNLKLGTIEKDLPSLQKSFTDTGTIASNYSVPAILAVTKAKIMNGKQNTLAAGQKKPTYRFDPQASLTRAEAATISKAIMTKLKKL